MKSFLILISLILIITSAIFGGDPEGVAGVYETTINSSFSDFADVEFYFDGYIGWYVQQGYFYYVAEIWDGNDWVRADYKQFHFGPPAPQYIYYYDADVQVELIADDGDGNFRIKGNALADNALASSDWQYFQVDDNTSPSTPTNLAVQEVENHPYLTWDENSEIDVEKYKIYKKVGTESWEPYANTIHNYYTDQNELMNGSNQYPNPTIIQYKITAEDYTSNESGFSTAVQCTCKGDAEDGAVASNFSSCCELNQIPDKFEIKQNYPNPFNPETNITFGIPEDNFVNLVVYNIQGEKVATLVNEQLNAGSYTTKFNGSLLPSGVYIYQIQAGSFSQIKRMLLIK